MYSSGVIDALLRVLRDQPTTDADDDLLLMEFDVVGKDAMIEAMSREFGRLWSWNDHPSAMQSARNQLEAILMDMQRQRVRDDAPDDTPLAGRRLRLADLRAR